MLEIAKAIREAVPLDSRGFIVLCVAVGGLMLGLAGWLVDKSYQKQKSTGVLTSKDAILSDKRADRLVEVGTSGVTFGLDGSPYSEPFRQILGDSQLIIEEIEGRLMVSTNIRGSKGDLLAELRRNEWTTVRQAILDRNFTRDALEVRDQSGDVVLQIRVLPDRIQIQGKWYFADGKRTVILDPKDYPGYAKIVFAADASTAESQMRIQPMFSYPSTAHLGELLPPSPLVVEMLGDSTQRGKYWVTEYEVSLPAGVTLPSLYLELEGPTVAKIAVRSRQTGAATKGVRYKLKNGIATAVIGSARGAYVVATFSAKRDRVFVRHSP